MTRSRSQSPGAVSTFAMVDPGLMGMSLFRPLPRRDREAARKRMFELDMVHDGRKLRVVGAYTLGADDLRTLLAILALAGLMGMKVEAALSESARVDIRDGLESSGDVLDAIHIRTTTTLYAICREAGISPGGDSYGRVIESLRRIRAVHYDDLGPVGANHRRLNASGKQNLLVARAREDTGEIVVVLNARFAGVLLGEQFVRVNLAEARDLGEMARLLHLRLSVMVRVHHSMTVGTDQLAAWVYGSDARTTREAQDRRKELRQGMAELGQLAGWAVSENRRRLLVAITRSTATKPAEMLLPTQAAL